MNYMAQEQQYTPEQMEQIKKKLASMKPEEIQEMIKKQCIFCRILAGERDTAVSSSSETPSLPVGAPASAGTGSPYPAIPPPLF